MKFRILNSKEKREFERKNNMKIEGVIIKTNDSMRIYTGNLSREELERIFKNINVLRIGLKL